MRIGSLSTEPGKDIQLPYPGPAASGGQAQLQQQSMPTQGPKSSGYRTNRVNSINEPATRNAVSSGGENWIQTQRSTNIVGASRKLPQGSMNYERNQKQNNSMLNPHKYGSNPLSAGQVTSADEDSGIFSKRNSRASKSRGATNKTPIIQDRYGKKK